MSRNIVPYNFNFKLAYSNKIMTMSFDSNINIDTFINRVSISAVEFFQLDDICVPDDILIIESGQPNNINGRDAELAPPINYSSMFTLKDIYEYRWRSTSFYIRW